MKKFKKILVSVLSLMVAFCLTLSVGFACGDNEDNDDAKFQGTHILTATDTDKEFIKNGRTNYKLVVPEAETTNETIAKNEFVWLFNEATGINIASIKDEGVTHSADQKFISIGRTSLLESSGIEVDSKILGNDGLRIVTKDDNVYICGGGDSGTVYGVYDFFEIAFNYIYVFTDAFSIDRNVKNMNLKNFDVTDIPDIAQRSPATGYEKNYTDDRFFGSDNYEFYAGYRARVPHYTGSYMAGTLRYVQNSNKTFNIGTVGDYEGRVLPELKVTDDMHNNLNLLSPDVYRKSYPEWYSAGGDLCFTAHGDEDAYQAMVDEVAFRLRECMMAYRLDSSIHKTVTTRRYILPVTMEDGAQACSCEKCKEYTQKYGQMSSTLIIFMNDLYEKLFGAEGILEEERLKCEADPNYGFIFEPESVDCKLRYEDYYHDDYIITFFAYAYFADPPCVQDEKGNWVVSAPEMYLKDRIVPWTAFQQEPWEDFNSDNNLKQRFKNRIEGWSEVAGDNGIMYYEYATTFSFNSLNPDGTFQGMTPEYYNFLAKNGCFDLFCDSRAFYDKYPSSFDTLLFYLRSKMSWNSSVDYQTLVDNYFKIMFGDAKETMYQLYLSQRDYAAHNWNCDELYKSDTSKADYWSYQVALDWEASIAQARKEIEPLKEIDPEAYEIYSGHIDVEWLCPAQHILVYHKQKISSAKVIEYKQELERIVNDWDKMSSKCYKGTFAQFLATL